MIAETLIKAGARGALEDGEQLTHEAFQILTKFTHNGQLGRVDVLDHELCWLLGLRDNVSGCRQLAQSLGREFLDHTRLYRDSWDSRRYLVSSPYVNFILGKSTNVPEWRKHQQSGPLRLLTKRGLTADEKIWRGLLLDEIEKIRTEAEKWAQQFGLTVAISPDSWYYPIACWLYLPSNGWVPIRQQIKKFGN